MKKNDMDWKVWVALIVLLIIIGGIFKGMGAKAETTPTDMVAVENEASDWLDEVDGTVILDDPAYFMDLEEDEGASAVEEPAPSSTADTVATAKESATPSAEPSDTTEQPDNPTDQPVDPPVTDTTDTPTDSQEPENPTDQPVDPPVTDTADTPTDSQQPDNSTEQPADPPVTDTTDTPTDSQEPENPTDQPADSPVTDTTDTPTDGQEPETPTDQPTDAPATDTPTTEPTDTPTTDPTETPVDLKALFDVNIKVPSAWRNSYSATVRIKITPAGERMWEKVRYRIGDEEWETVPDKDFVLYDGYYYTDIEVFYNAKMTVRLFGDEENYFDANKEIRIFDHYEPEVTAGFRDLVLHVEAVDDLSQVAGIQVNNLLFTTLTDGVLDIRMEAPLNTYKQLAIRAYDYAGNFSEPVTLDNPYYVEPTPEPTATPKPTTKPTTKPTKKPSSSSSSNKKPTATPVVTATPAPTQYVPQQQIIYVTPDPSLYTYTQPVATAEPETVYVPLGPGQPYKSEGNMQTLDMLYSASTNKQFITVQTRAGETYYMVIDYDKPIDEENDIYETYFLNLVDDRDLMSVVSEDEIQPTPTPQIVYVTPEPVEQPPQTTPIVVEDNSLEEMAPMTLLVLGVAAVGGAAFWLIKSRKEKNARNIPDFEEYDFEDEDSDEV